MFTSLALFTVLPYALKAQDATIKKAASQLEKWVERTPQEKVYLHFDKPYYAAGDDIWFKAYITAGPKHELSGLSGALNVELIDSRDSVKQSVKLPVIAGTAYGDFALSDTLEEGTYRIRAYTNYMRNFDAAYFFDKTITIGNAGSGAVYTTTHYAYALQNGHQQANVIINYAAADGKPYIYKEVSYQLVVSDKNTIKGKAITNDKGAIDISFPGLVLNNNSPGRIITRIKTGEKTTVVKMLPIKAASGNTDVQFFPESGSLISGIPSRVAFKAVGADGLGAAISGIVIDDNNLEVAKIVTRHLGMGSFLILPQAGKNYKAQITFADGSQRVINLAVKQEGYVVGVNPGADEENIGIRIYASEGLQGKEINLGSAKQRLYLLRSKKQNRWRSNLCQDP